MAITDDPELLDMEAESGRRRLRRIFIDDAW
jgi:hypothetical protein